MPSSEPLSTTMVSSGAIVWRSSDASAPSSSARPFQLGYHYRDRSSPPDTLNRPRSRAQAPRAKVAPSEPMARRPSRLRCVRSA